MSFPPWAVLCSALPPLLSWCGHQLLPNLPSWGAAPAPPPRCYLGLNKGFLRTPAVPLCWGWRVMAPCPAPVPHILPHGFCLALCPGREQGLECLIRAPHLSWCHGTGSKQPGGGLSVLHTWGGGVWCVPDSLLPAPWQQLCLCSLHVPILWMLPPILRSQPGSGPRTGTRVTPGVLQEQPVIAAGPRLAPGLGGQLRTSGAPWGEGMGRAPRRCGPPGCACFPRAPGRGSRLSGVRCRAGSSAPAPPRGAHRGSLGAAAGLVLDPG